MCNNKITLKAVQLLCIMYLHIWISHIYYTLNLSDHTGFVFMRLRIRISALTPGILLRFSVIFVIAWSQMRIQFLKIGHDRVYSRSLSLINFFNRRYVISISEKASLNKLGNKQCRLQWPRGLRHDLSSLVRTLGLWVRIPFKAWMSVFTFILCLCYPVCR
jgi:hypothetical protein